MINVYQVKPNMAAKNESIIIILANLYNSVNITRTVPANNSDNHSEINCDNQSAKACFVFHASRLNHIPYFANESLLIMASITAFEAIVMVSNR